MSMQRVHFFTIQELHEKLGEFLAENPDLSEFKILMDGRDQYANWDGTFSVSNGLTAVILGDYTELWYNDDENGARDERSAGGGRDRELGDTQTGHQ